MATHRARRASAAREQRSDRGLQGLLLPLLILIGGGLFAAALLPTIGAAGRGVHRVAEQLDGIGKDVELALPRPIERSTIYATDGTILATVFLDENRKVVNLRQVNDLTRDAILAIEDARFYEHRGLDTKAIIRAVVRNVAAGEILQGASTLTQQLVRNRFPEEEVGTEQTLERKLTEARVAMRLEQEYSKDEILELYLNEVYFGRSVYGVGTAAEFYFGKSAKKLTLPEAATLAGLIAAPERYSPVVDEEASLGRRNLVLDRMEELGYVTPQQAAAARAAPMDLNQKIVTGTRRFPFFVEHVKQEIIADPDGVYAPVFGKSPRARERFLGQGGLEIYTTLDPNLQRAGRQVGREHLPRAADPAVPENAIAAINPRTGAVRALASNQDFSKSQVNVATGGSTGRQAGSAFKPFTLVAAFEQGIPPSAVYSGGNGQVVNCGSAGSYKVINAGGSSYGNLDLWAATRSSVNAIFVQLAVDAGLTDNVEVANRMGIESDLLPVCSLPLGTNEVTPLEMASAYATLANEGVHCPPFTIARVEDRDGEVIFKHKRKQCEEVIDPDVAALTVNLLQGVVSGGTGTAANLSDVGPWPVFGKTGSTNDVRDAWFTGCTRQLCAASWVGHVRGQVAMYNITDASAGTTFSQVYGGTIPALIWHDFMAIAMQGRPPEVFPGVPTIRWPTVKIPDVVGMTVDQAIRILTEAGFRAEEVRVPSTEPAGTVVAQSPAGGSRATRGTAVQIEVSNGRAPKSKVPDVVGMTEARATEALESAGFIVSVAHEKTSNKGLDGIVAAQAPGAGVKAKEGSTVTITVLEFKKPKPSPKDE